MVMFSTEVKLCFRKYPVFIVMTYRDDVLFSLYSHNFIVLKRNRKRDVTVNFIVSESSGGRNMNDSCNEVVRADI